MWLHRISLKRRRLAGCRLQIGNLRQKAAIRIYQYGCKHVMIKGGHEANTEQATDLLYDGTAFTEFTSKRLVTQHTHGTGCTFAAALTSGLAQGLTTKDVFAVGEELHPRCDFGAIAYRKRAWSDESLGLSAGYSSC